LPSAFCFSLLRYRLILGAILIAAFALLCWLDYHHSAGAPAGAWLFPIAVILSVLASQEMLGLLRAGGHDPIAWVVYLGNLLIVLSNGVPMFWPGWATSTAIDRIGWPFSALAVACIAAFIGEMARYEKPGRVASNLGVTILSLVYVGVFFTFVVLLSNLIQLLSLIAVVKMGDTGAYTVGRLIGRHKMTPVLSPGKTWEGAGGAAVFAVIGAWGVINFLGPQLGLPAIEFWRVAVFGLIVGAAGLLGDLAESMLKRDAGRKDSSTWMPGFGGVLDVLDSILFAAPIAYMCWAGGLLGGH
jgi:phosphatidate cytidylyltransferase